jgi:hypothetical protein
MNNYNSILVLHAVDSSTQFLSKFKEEFSDNYFPFSSEKESVNKAKSRIGDLEPKSLIIYIGHGSSSGLYEPDETHEYKNYFLDATWGNHYLDEHDVFLLSCNSNVFIQKIYKSNFSLGFGNIISSKEELDIHNEKNKVKKTLSKDEIKVFNEIYMKCSIKVIKSLVNEKVRFIDVQKQLRFHINKEINNILLNRQNSNRIEFARILFEFRNELLLNYNIR